MTTVTLLGRNCAVMPKYGNAFTSVYMYRLTGVWWRPGHAHQRNSAVVQDDHVVLGHSCPAAA